MQKEASLLGISSEHRTAFLRDIFGSDFKQEKVLVDSDGCEDFDAKLDSMQEVWNSRKKEARGTALSESSAAKFHAYSVTHVSQNMIAPVRKQAGLQQLTESKQYQRIKTRKVMVYGKRKNHLDRSGRLTEVYFRRGGKKL